MKHSVICLLALLPLFGQAPRKTESFWSKLLRITGVSATPGGLRDDAGPKSGDVWVVSVDRSDLRPLAQGGGWRSPVFEKSGDVLVLRGDRLYRLPATGAQPASLGAVPNAVKLVGVSRDDPDQALVVVSSAGQSPQAATFSIRSGALVVLPHDPQSDDDVTLMGHLLSSERVYGETRLCVVTVEKPAAGDTTVSFAHIFLRRGDSPAVNLTSGDSLQSGQPSLSADGRRVVFIRSRR